MTNEIRNTLYNKTKEELTLEDKLYINKIIETKKNNSKNWVKHLLVSVTHIAWLSMGILFLVINEIPFAIFNFTGLTAGVLGHIWGIYDSKKLLSNQLNLTNKECKQLKKSGRIEELYKMLEGENIQILNDLNNLSTEIDELQKEDDDKSWQEDIAEQKFINKLIGFNAKERKEYINTTINNKKEKRKGLIARMVEENQITQEEANRYLSKFETENLTSEQTEIINEENIFGMQ